MRLAPPPKKKLPPCVKRLRAMCDYAIVKFTHRDEAYTETRTARSQFKVINSKRTESHPPQVEIHLHVEGIDNHQSPPHPETLDVDFYLPISRFRRMSALLRDIGFKKDKHGVLRAYRRKRASRRN